MAKRDLNPQPRAWPRCSECKTDYILRRSIVFKTKPGAKRMNVACEWIWQRDCQHREAEPEVTRTRKATP